jgi:hypothetical protein
MGKLKVKHLKDVPRITWLVLAEPGRVFLPFTVWHMGALDIHPLFSYCLIFISGMWEQRIMLY